MNRRDALRTIGAGFGTLGLIDVLQASAGPLAPKAPHFPAKAKRVIFLFLNGGMSHIDTFDPKPMLIKHDGQPLPGPKIQTDRASGNLMRSPFTFQKARSERHGSQRDFPACGVGDRRHLRDSVDVFG